MRMARVQMSLTQETMVGFPIRTQGPVTPLNQTSIRTARYPAIDLSSTKDGCNQVASGKECGLDTGGIECLPFLRISPHFSSVF